VIRTLHWYLSRDLLKVSFLALVAFTLVLTVFAIVEPLRKEGLSSDQVLSLFGYTLPVMLSLTLPIAALFASTIVYGRFSQDNELMACRASGIAAISVLKPAMVLGALVTAASLVLSNFVAPKLARMGAEAARTNVRGIVYNRLRSQGYVKEGHYIIHADTVDPDRDMLIGVVVADVNGPEVNLMAASSTRVKFQERDGEWYLGVQLDRVDFSGTRGTIQPGMRTAQIESLPLPTNMARERVSMYDWNGLMETFKEPYRHPEVQRTLKRIQRRILFGMMACDIADTINGRDANRPCAELCSGSDRYQVQAGKASVDDRGIVHLSRDGPVPVSVVEYQGGSAVQSFTADAGTVRGTWSPISNSAGVTLRLQGNVKVRPVGDPNQETSRDDWVVGQLEVPPEIVGRAQGIDLSTIYNRPEDLPPDRSVLGDIDYLKTKGLRKIRGEVLAEIHGRLAYGVSCFLLVAMGAALGLIFRGGQVISAFAISVVPAAIVIVMIIMGKELLGNPGVSMVAGLVAIWSGIVLLIGANVGVYAHLLRR
jgi:lipopolysaccharide export LptBFGC system permease protein LptF